MIGENDSLILLDEAFYYSMQEICQSLSRLGAEEKSNIKNMKTCPRWKSV